MIVYKYIENVLDEQTSENIIWPGTIARAMGMPIVDVYMDLEDAVKDGKIKQVLAVRCPTCDAVMETYATVGEVPDTMICTCCGKSVSDLLSKAVVAYRKSE